MKLLGIICVLLCARTTLAEDFKERKPKEDHKRVRRDGGLTAAIVGASISAGASLVGTTVGALKRPNYAVAVSGSVENYSKWPLTFKGCEIKSGYMNTPMRSVAPGQREGFAGHKTGGTATGSWIRCSFSVAGRMAHFMYSAPYSFDLDSNTLAVAVCSSDNAGCSNLNAYQMYHHNRDYMARREYYYNVHTVKACNLGFCITGVMGTNHHPEIDLKVMPVKYEDLSGAAKDSSLKDRWNKGDYEHFVKSS